MCTMNKINYYEHSQVHMLDNLSLLSFWTYVFQDEPFQTRGMGSWPEADFAIKTDCFESFDQYILGG